MITAFIDNLHRQGKSDVTQQSYLSSWNRFATWFGIEYPHPTPNGGPMEPQMATQLDVANFKRQGSKLYKPSTLALTMVHLNVIFRWMVQHGHIPDNPVENLDRLTVPQSAPKWLNRQEQNSLIRMVRQHGDIRELAIITLMLHSGVRVQELCDIRMNDLKLSERKGTLTIQSGKHGKYREIPLNIDIRRVLARYLETRQTTGDYLFYTQRREKMTTKAVQCIVKKYSRLTGIEHLTCHTLRHTFAHELSIRKVPMDVIARLMGHMKSDGSPNLAMTSRYTMPGEDDLARAVEELSWV
ncbi:tyrosine-type recombinase/integrase [Heliobacillus mobilis]|uniref:Tyrosine-type recombinase/integrase n=1 Tax=Heliobacterium mobile TaxID=28064 RepID=A0A6I3SM54_HELMO|nr:tyrosine-type recombinase/integrase [Heliobacterium mobile]MTV50053.1 tyrosine-type recombinase/integrase [Heliobacterium mobile]